VNKKQGEMAIFTRTTDFIAWLVPMTNHFPKLHRYTVTRRLLDAAMDFLEHLVKANGRRGSERRNHLRRADDNLGKIRLYLRLAHRWQWLNDGQYKHAGRLVAELGRLLGGWMKSVDQRAISGGPAAGVAGNG
jgi:23S rRNA-intervening sequence protein